MALAPNVFITWSKERSKAAALALYGWLPLVIQAVKPWMSERDIGKGQAWFTKLIEALASVKHGLICLTPESLSEPWVLFETGVIFKGLSEGRVWTYLLGGLKPSDVPQPLGLFQHTITTEADTFGLLQSINEAMGDRRVSSEILQKQFKTYWPELDKRLSELPAAGTPIMGTRSVEDMFAELLETVRSQERRVTRENLGRVLSDAVKTATYGLNRVEQTHLAQKTAEEVLLAIKMGGELSGLSPEDIRRLTQKTRDQMLEALEEEERKRDTREGKT